MNTQPKVVKKSCDIFLYFLGCSALFNAHSIARANSSPSLEITQINPDSSGVVGDTFEDFDSTREQQLIDPLIIPQPIPIRRTLTPIPGSTIGVPTAYGATWGDVFIGGSGAVTDEGVVDTAASFGFGLGDPKKFLGLEVGLGIASLFGDNAGAGLVGFKVHRVLAKDTRIAAGWANAITWDVATAGETVYGSLTHQFKLQPNNEDNQLPLTMTLGVGTGAYRSIGSLKAGENVPNVFGSVGFRVIPRLSLISTWTGSQLNVGTSIAPLNVPLTINLAATDVTSNRDFDDDQISRTGFLMSTGYVFKF